MSDSTLNRFLASGTAAERAAFTPSVPSPASGPDPLYLWQETDTGQTYAYADGAWALVSGEPISLPPVAGSTFNTYVVSGGQVVWTSGLSFRVSAAIYYINGVRYESAEQTITLDAADGSNPRLDVIALDTAVTVQKITGTAAAAASEPTADPASYVKLALVSVPTGASAPAGATTTTLYAENAGSPTEWTWTASAGSMVVNGTTTPHAGTYTIEGTAVAAGVYVRGEKPSGTIDPNAYDHVLLFLRSKATWNNNRGLLVSFRSSGVLVGAAVQIRRTGTFGFDSAVTSGYQQVAIPVTAFAVPIGSTVNQLQIEDFGGSIGFFIDDVSLQVGASTPATQGITQAQADARYARLVHATRHASGGADAIKLDDLAAPDDNTDLNASTSTHGLLKKLDNDTTHFLRGDGAWAAPTPTRTFTIPFVIDGGGSAISTGVKGDVEVPVGCTITAVRLLADVSGSLVIDIWKDTYANLPPTGADTITASAKPTLSSAQKSEDTTLTGWTTAISAGNWLRFNVDSASTVTRVTVSITCVTT